MISLAGADARVLAQSCDIPVTPRYQFAKVCDWPEAGVDVPDAHAGIPIRLPAAATAVGNRRVVLIPFGEFPLSLLQVLQFYYCDHLGLALEIRESLPISTNVADAQRG